jgi:hypothetical protein
MRLGCFQRAMSIESGGPFSRFIESACTTHVFEPVTNDSTHAEVLIGEAQNYAADATIIF